MKNKFFINILIALNILILVGCNMRSFETTDKTSDFDIKVAYNVVDTYMKYLMKEDMQNIKKFYSKKLYSMDKEVPNKNLKITGYNISEANEIGKKGAFKVKVTRINTDKAYAVLDEYNINVIKEGIDYKIDEINNLIEKEALYYNKAIRLRNKNDVKTNLIIDNSGIPNYIFTKEDKANIYKQRIPKDNFGVMNFNYEGDSLAISTYGENSFAGIVSIEETLAVQGEGEEEEKGKNGEGVSDTQIKEKPIGKELILLDLFNNSKIEFMTFSLEQKYIVIQYKNKDNSRCIRVYRTDSGDIIPYNFEKKYPLDFVDVVFSSFDKEKLNFDVVKKGNETKDISKFIGKWQMDLKNFSVKKL